MTRRFRRSALLRSPAILGLAGVLVLAGCSGQGSDASSTGSDEAAPIEGWGPVSLTYSTIEPETSNGAAQAQALADEVTAQIGESVEFEMFYAGSLVPPVETLQGVGAGLADIGGYVPSYTPDELPVMNWAASFIGSYDRSAPQGQMSGISAASELLNDPAIVDEFASHNVKLLTIGTTSPHSLLCMEPFESVEDLQGRRVRVTGPLWQQEVEALGMTTVSLAYGEQYEALQRGVVDCVFNSVEGIDGLDLWDVAKYYGSLPGSGAVSGTLINLDTWNSFPDEVKAAFELGAVDWMYTFGAASAETGSAVFAPGGVLDTAGVEVMDTSSIAPVLLKFKDKRLADIMKAAPAGVEDPQAMINDYTASSDAWLEEIADATKLPLLHDAPPADQYSAAADADFEAWRTLLIEARSNR